MKEIAKKRSLLGAGVYPRSAHLGAFLPILVTFGYLSVNVSLGQDTPRQAEFARRSERLLIATIKARMPGLLEGSSVPGAAIALIRNGEVVWTEGFGWADVAGKRHVSSETIFILLISAEGNPVATDRLDSVRNAGPGNLGYQAQYPYGKEYSTTGNDRRSLRLTRATASLAWTTR